MTLLAKNQLQQLENQLRKEEQRVQNKCKSSRKEIETVEKHRRVLTLWKDEAEKRGRKSTEGNERPFREDR